MFSSTDSEIRQANNGGDIVVVCFSGKWLCLSIAGWFWKARIEAARGTKQNEARKALTR
jgi:hypothetical protein